MLQKINDSLNSGSTRSSLVKKNILGTIILKGITIPTQLLLVPLTIGYISSEMYGIWLTLTSIIGWIGFLDIGFGNGLRNRLAETLAQGDNEKGKKYVSTTYFCLFVIFGVVCIIGYFTIPLLDWTKILNTSASYQQTIVEVMQIVLFCFCLQMVLKVQTSTWMALQMNAVASIADALGQVVTLVGIWILTITTYPSLVLMAWVFNGCTIIILCFTTFYLFMIKRKDLKPNVYCIDIKCAKGIMSLGGKFFIIQIAAIVTFQMTNIILSNTCGPESVTEYNIIYKYLSIANMVIAMIVAPIWSAYTDAYTRKDSFWMLNTYKKLKRIFIIGVLGIIVMVLIYPTVFDIWLGDKVTVHTDFVIIVAIYIVTTMWSSIHSSIINGIGKIKFSMIFCNIQTIINIPVCYFMGINYGAKGVVLGIIFVTLPSLFAQPYQTKHLILGTAKGIWNK